MCCRGSDGGRQLSPGWAGALLGAGRGGRSRSASAAAGPPPTAPLLRCAAPSREGCQVQCFLHSSGKFKHFLVLVFFLDLLAISNLLQ